MPSKSAMVQANATRLHTFMGVRRRRGLARTSTLLLVGAGCYIGPRDYEPRTVSFHPGAPATLDWTAGDTAGPIWKLSFTRYEQDGGQVHDDREPWTCESPSAGRSADSSQPYDDPGDPADMISPPIVYGVTPRTKRGVLWKCRGTIELFADSTYQVELDGRPRDDAKTYLFTGISASPPPDLIIDTSFETGDCVNAPYGSEVGVHEIDCSPQVSVAGPTGAAHSGATACSICEDGTGEASLIFPLVPRAPGHYTFEAWVRGTALPTYLNLVLRWSHLGGVSVNGMPAPQYGPPVSDEYHCGRADVLMKLTDATGDFAVVRAEADIPPAPVGLGDHDGVELEAELRTSMPASGCLAIDDVKLSRE